MKASLLIALWVGLLFAAPALAGVIRVSLLLTGDECSLQRQALSDQLGKIHGIVSVDGRSVPDHLLIDVEPNTATAEQLVLRANEVLSTTACKAEEMKSCISAELSVEHSEPTQH
ncbi:MAG: hypothetical protein AB7G68_15415 [Nitrospiraceae bacterium]